jgi:3-oxoacyl-(acyl-carrier-protein) synthase
MNQALTRAGVEPQQIGAVVIAANGGAVDAAEEKALAALFGQSDPPHRVPAKRLTGESLACHSVIGTALASVMIHKGEIPMCGAEAGTVPMIAAKPFILVNSFELGGGVVAIVVGPPSVPQTEGYA